MQSTCGLRARIVLCFLIVVSASLCTAKDGRDFAGFYSVDQANQQDGLVQLKFSLRVYNYSANDIKQAYVALREPGPGLSVRANFHPVKSWRMQRDVKLSAQVVITLALLKVDLTTQPSAPEFQFIIKLVFLVVFSLVAEQSVRSRATELSSCSNSNFAC